MNSLEKIFARTWIIFGLLLIFSLSLRLIRLNMGLWLDELFTLTEFVRGSWKDIFTFYSAPNNHILYSLLAKICVRIFGEKEWSLRLPSLILGSVTPPILFLRFRKIFDEEKALFASLMMAVSFWMVWFSQDARGYAGMILFSSLSQVLYMDWRQNPRGRTAFYYILCSVLACWFHLYAVFIITGQILYSFFKWDDTRPEQRRFLLLLPVLALVLGLSLYSLVFDQLLVYAQKGGKEIEGRWLGLYFWKDLLKMLSGTQFLSFALAGLVLFLIGLFHSVKSDSAFTWLYLLPAGLIIMLTLVLKIFILPRFLAFLTPFFFITISEGMEFIDFELRKLFPTLRLRVIYFSLALVIFIFLGLGLVRYYHLGKQGFKEASLYIKRKYPAQDVLSVGVTDYEYLYYDPYAEPWPGANPLTAEKLRGKLVVLSHSWSISPENLKLIQEHCELEKFWPSAGSEEYRVSLFKCFK